LLVETFEKLRPCVVALASKFASTPAGQKPLFPTIIGTGFLVDGRGIVATNRHVIEALDQLPRHPSGKASAMAIVWTEVQEQRGGHALPIVFADVKEYWAIARMETESPFYGEDVPDVGFVQIEASGLPALELAREPNALKMGLAVATAGFPLGTDPLVVYEKVTQITPLLRHGIISSLYPFPCPHPHGFTLDITIQGGVSGSPVFPEDSPRAVGMLSAFMVRASNIAIGIPSHIVSDALSQMLEANKPDFSTTPTIQSILEKSERSDQLKWETLGYGIRGQSPDESPE